jgi:hypothetical protein
MLRQFWPGADMSWHTLCLRCSVNFVANDAIGLLPKVSNFAQIGRRDRAKMLHGDN